MSKKDRKKPKTIRVHNVILTYDTERSDSELEQFSIELTHEINLILQQRIPHELPQFTIEVDKNKKLKISVRPHEDDENAE